jgi:hypothetical protein
MSLKARLARLEKATGGDGGPSYASFGTLADYEAAVARRVKAYIGVSPDDWPDSETEVTK